MPRLEQGIARALSEIITGFVISALLHFFANINLISPSLLSIFKLLDLMAAITFITALPYWGTGYMLGWLCGFVIMFPTGILSTFDLIIYIMIPLMFLVLRLIKRALN